MLWEVSPYVGNGARERLQTGRVGDFKRGAWETSNGARGRLQTGRVGDLDARRLVCESHLLLSRLLRLLLERLLLFAVALLQEGLLELLDLHEERALLV